MESRIESRGPTVVESEIEGCLALFHPLKTQVLVLNETASDVWRLIDGQLTLEAIVLALSHAYGAEPEAIRADVGRTVVLLRTHGFLADPSE